MSESQDIGKPIIVRFETNSGVIIHVTPLNLATLRAINLKADELNPYPDKKEYELPLENTFVPGQTDSAENNPVYIEACKPIDQKRKEWVDKAVFNYAVRFRDYASPSDVIQAFAPRLLELRKIAVLPEDDYEAILHHIILSGNTVRRNEKGVLYPVTSEYTDIIQIAIQSVALTPDEVTAGVRFFRANLQRDTSRRSA